MPVINENKYNETLPTKLVELLIKEKITPDDLEVNNKNHVQAVYNFYKQMPSKMKDISTKNEYDFLVEVLKKDYKLFVNLDKKQYKEDNTQIFLEAVLRETRKNKKDNNDTSEIYSSYDEKIAISYDYVTRKGDELYYFDNELKVPASLISKFKVVLRIENPVEFVKMLDVSVRDFCAPIVFNNLYYIFNSSFRKILWGLLSKADSGYYKITNSILEIENLVKKEIDSCFPSKCAVASYLVIKRIEVDREVREKIEDEFFELRKKRINIDEEIKYQKDSLDIFSKKLELLDKYKAPKEMLTEAEKDKAFDRYAKKGMIAKVDKRASSNLEEKVDEQLNGGIALGEDTITTKKSSVFAVLRFITGAMFVISLIIALSLVLTNGFTGVGMILSGSFGLVFGLTLIITGVIQKKKGTQIVNLVDENKE